MARSENWRINKSGIMAVEGAQTLKALQKVAGAAGLPKDFHVRFATKSIHSGINFDEKEVVIGAGRLFTEAPIPAENFDVLVGLTLHETGHHQIDTAKVMGLARDHSRYMTSQEAALFDTFVNIGEDIVIESRIRNNPNLAEYDQSLHNWAITQMRDATPEKLLEVWIEYALGHKSTTVLGLPPELDEPMQQLVALTGWLRSNSSASGTAYNSSTRYYAYERYWETVKEAILNPPKPPQQAQDNQDSPDNQDQQSGDSEPSDDDDAGKITGVDKDSTEPDKQDEPNKQDDGDDSQQQPDDDVDSDAGSDPDDSDPQDDGSDASTGDAIDDLDRPLAPNDEDAIDDDLADAIDDAIESDQEDISDEVEDVLGKSGLFSKRSVIRSRETKTPLIKPDQLLRKRLERIMTIRKRLQARTMHGEQYGRIDKRHLHRVATDERIFSLRYKFPDGFPNTKILIDLSISMSGTEADEVLEAAGALQTLVNAEVWCYNGAHDSTVQLVRMDNGKLIHRRQPTGNTPSGLAIAGVSVGMKKGGLIIHLTDGEHNSGQSPWEANWALKKNGIDLVNLIWGNSGKIDQHYNMDGMNFRRLDGLAGFPDALYHILIEQTKLGNIGGK